MNIEKQKKWAEISGENWEAGIPFCGGCPELILGNGFFCGYEGNGCRFPERRVQRPRTFYTAFIALQNNKKVSDEEVRKMEIDYFKKKENY